MKPYIIRRPIITEKTLQLANLQNVYVFEVERLANKKEVKEAVEDIFQVHVSTVNTVMHHSGKKSTGRKRLKVVTAKTKKVMVKLKAGEKIALFDVTGGQTKA
ncbi:MAG TPA: 50S ribosomal protein L23 [Candidatus Pacebacteria bacterium]|nr:50S ribosomal protein L23 [Candidatus Paceibacterota bacterium]